VLFKKILPSFLLSRIVTSFAQTIVEVESRSKEDSESDEGEGRQCLKVSRAGLTKGSVGSTIADIRGPVQFKSKVKNGLGFNSSSSLFGISFLSLDSCIYVARTVVVLPL